MADFGGFDLTHPINRIRAGVCALAVNVRAYIKGGFTLRNALTNAILTVAAAVESIARLNDTTPSGPVGGFIYVIKDADGNLYAGTTGTLTAIGTGFSVNPVSLVAFRPNTSVEPWNYVGDDSQAVTISTKFLISGTPTTFGCFGLVKVRSDGLIYKTGIKEPQSAPVVSTSGTTTTGTASLPATTIPWTNVGGANPSYNYGHTSGVDGTAPVIILTPAGSQTLQLVITGTATVNSATHAPGDAGPATGTYPANFTGAGPTIVVGAFTDGSGNVLTGASPVPLLANVGAAITLQVPSAAVRFQIGIDSSANTFSANSGAFSIAWTLVTSAVATKVSTLGQVTTYYWDDSPHSGPVARYIWKNPNDTTSSGIPRTSSTAVGTSQNNSWWFDSTPEDDTVAMQWNTLDSTGAVVGSFPVFSTPSAVNAPNFDNFNLCIVGSLFFPTAGKHTFTFQFKDQILVGFGSGATASNQTGFFRTSAIDGQTESVINALPLVLIGDTDGSGTHHTASVDITVAGPGAIQVEVDYDYWYHSGRSMIMTCDGAVIPPLPSGVRTNVVYWAKYRSSATGAVSNPSPASTAQVTPVLDNTVSVAYSPDPQVDKVDFYRQDSGLPNPTYVATGPNTNPPTAITDALTDLAAASNPTMNTDDFEPFPSIDTPKAGVVNLSGGVITWVSGNQFNTRWLAGTVIEIGSPTQLAYTLWNRPSSATAMYIPGVPDGTNLVYNIAEPILANQPLPYIFGPTDNINYELAVGDPLRPGTLYWCKGSNFDSAPDTNQMDVTDPSEALVNGAMSGGRGVLFSIKRAWVIMPNFFNALATSTGTSGTPFTLQATSINRGLFMPRCVAVDGGGLILFRVDDGIHASPGGLASQSITDETLYNLFPHEGSTPAAVVRNGITIYPPDDSQPQRQKFQIINGYLYYDYYDTTNTPRTLVFDIAAKGWVWDVYAHPVTARASNEGTSVQGTIVGCSDGTVRQFATTGSETPTGTVLTPAIGGQGWQHLHEITVEYLSNAPVTLSCLAADAGQGSYGPPSITLPTTAGGATKLNVNVGPNKWKFMWFQFQSTDPNMQIYCDGFAVQRKDWGSTGGYEQVNPFSPSGGFGGQP
jgi:hypothetical protein